MRLSAQWPWIRALKKVELFTRPGDDHNISKNFTTAISRSVKFFDEQLKK